MLSPCRGCIGISPSPVIILHFSGSVNSLFFLRTFWFLKSIFVLFLLCWGLRGRHNICLNDCFSLLLNTYIQRKFRVFFFLLLVLVFVCVFRLLKTPGTREVQLILSNGTLSSSPWRQSGGRGSFGFGGRTLLNITDTEGRRWICLFGVKCV